MGGGRGGTDGMINEMTAGKGIFQRLLLLTTLHGSERCSGHRFMVKDITQSSQMEAMHRGRYRDGVELLCPFQVCPSPYVSMCSPT